MTVAFVSDADRWQGGYLIKIIAMSARLTAGLTYAVGWLSIANIVGVARRLES